MVAGVVFQLMKRIIYLILTLGIFSSCDTLFFEDDTADNLYVYDAFYSEVDKYFSFFPYLSTDFDSAYQSTRALLEENPGNQQLAESLQALINVLEDGHTGVITPFPIYYRGYFNQVPVNTLPDITHYFDEYHKLNTVLEYGLISNTSMGYIKINRFGQAPSDYLVIDEVLATLSSASAIIIDVRSNGGGNSRNSDLIISRFNDVTRLMFKARRRSGGRNSFGEWVEVYTDVYEGYTFTKKVVVLTNRKSFSATEWFVAGMQTLPHVTVVGDTTGGGSGNPVMSELPNGWTMRVSNTQKRLPSGRDYQYLGLYPDVPVWISETDSLNNIDTILEKGIELLK